MLWFSKKQEIIRRDSNGVIARHRSPIAYCKKGYQSHEEWLESGPHGNDYGLRAVIFECGNPPQIQGARNDIERAVELLNENGYDLEDLARREPAIYIRHYRGFEALRERLDTNVRKFKTKVIWIYGPTGVGKSKFIGDLMDEGVNVYWKVNSHKWFNGYNGQSVVALDDYRRGGGYLLFNDMLRLFDRYPLQVEFKGGATQFLSRYIIVTSSQSPTQLLDGQTDDRIDQLLRRVEHVIELPNAVSKLRLMGIRNEILRTCGLLDACNTENNENRQPLTEIEGENIMNSVIRNTLEL